MHARFASTCPQCREQIRPGEQIRRGSTGRFVHAACAAAEPRWHDPDEREYMRGIAEVAQIQAFAPAGSALREQMYLEMELAAWNRGEEF